MILVSVCLIFSKIKMHDYQLIGLNSKPAEFNIAMIYPQAK